MKNITSTLSGLSSSLFLNVGLTKIAAKLDPIGSGSSQIANTSDAFACVTCVSCSFGARKQR